MVSILPMVDLLGNTAVDWFCILSYFRLDTLYRAFSRDVTRTKLIKNDRHFGVQNRFLERLACLRMEPRSYIEALDAELVGKEYEWTN